MVTAIHINADDYIRRAEQFSRLPAQVQTRVLRRGFRAVERSVSTQVVRMVVAGTDLRQKDVRRAMYTRSDEEGVLIQIKSGWIPLRDLGGALRTRKGVTVRGWGAHRSAFIVRKYGGHIFSRVGKDRLPIKKLHGPNPAAYVLKHRGAFQSVLDAEAERRLLPEMIRQINLLMRL